MMEFSHLDAGGQARMVDIGGKKRVSRRAKAEGKLYFNEATSQCLREANLPKGNPFEVARIAGIQAAKQTEQLIPLCHKLSLDYVDVQIQVRKDHFLIHSTREIHCSIMPVRTVKTSVCGAVWIPVN